jgi:hypothetical protein
VAAVKTQCCIRALLARAAVRGLRQKAFDEAQTESAITIQAQWRCYIYQRWLKKHRETTAVNAAMKLQGTLT